MSVPHDLKLKLRPAEEFPPVPWPRLHSAALYGPIGDFVKAAAAYTEADPPALLGSALAHCGSALGGRLQTKAGNATHCTCLYVGIIGRSAKARKGTSSKPVEAAMGIYDANWEMRVFNGFGSGAALIQKLAEMSTMLVMEPELARVLRVAHREGDDTGQVFRMAWDHDKVQNITKKSGVVEVGKNKYHLGALGHGTFEELSKTFTTTDLYGGTINRVLWFAADRAAVKPDGGHVPYEILRDLADAVLAAAESLSRHCYADPLVFPRDCPIPSPPDAGDEYGVDETDEGAYETDALRRPPPFVDPGQCLWAERAAETDQLWDRLFRQVAADDPPGLLGEAIARGEAQFLRLSLLYAAMDGTPTIKPEHVNAAHAVWAFCRASAAFLFRTSTGVSKADRIYNHLNEHGPIARGDVAEKVFGTHDLVAGEVEGDIDVLVRAGLVRTEKLSTAGRPKTLLHPLTPFPPGSPRRKDPPLDGSPRAGGKSDKGRKLRPLVSAPTHAANGDRRLAAHAPGR